MNIENEIEQLKDRNRRVEADKAWETSSFRIGLLTLVTFVVAAIVLSVMKVERVFITALVTAIAYFLSVQTLPAVKRWWIKKYQIKHGK
ncbi:MAG: hypothetical protein Q8P83_00920 [bacterium]|nr:hypothetical protein [bacterium]